MGSVLDNPLNTTTLILRTATGDTKPYSLLKTKQQGLSQFLYHCYRIAAHIQVTEHVCVLKATIITYECSNL